MKTTKKLLRQNRWAKCKQSGQNQSHLNQTVQKTTPPFNCRLHKLSQIKSKAWDVSRPDISKFVSQHRSWDVAWQSGSNGLLTPRENPSESSTSSGLTQSVCEHWVRVGENVKTNFERHKGRSTRDCMTGCMGLPRLNLKHQNASCGCILL